MLAYLGKKSICEPCDNTILSLIKFSKNPNLNFPLLSSHSRNNRTESKVTRSSQENLTWFSQKFFTDTLLF